MAPTLETTAICVFQGEVPGKKTLEQIVQENRGNAGKSPTYRVKVKRRNVTFKAQNGSAKKLKKVNFKRIHEIYSDDTGNITAMTVGEKDYKRTVLALEFKDSNTRKEFQALAKASNPGMKYIESKVEGSSHSETSKAADTVDPTVASEMTDNSNKREKSNISATPTPYSISNISPIVTTQKNEPNDSRKSPVTTESEVCSRCHQRIPRGMPYSHVSNDPSQSTSRRTTDSRKADYIYYVGRDGATAKVYQPRIQGPGGWRTFHTVESDKDGKLTINYDSLRSSTITTISSEAEGRGREIGTISCRNPISQRESLLQMQKSSRRSPMIYRSKSQPPSLYIIYEPEEKGDHYETEEDFDSTLKDDSRGDDDDDDSLSSYDDSYASTMSSRSRKIEKLIRELGKPGAIRLY